MDFNKSVNYISFYEAIMTNVNIYFIMVWSILVKKFPGPDFSVCVLVIFPHQETIFKHQQGV